jgi:predicted DNA-binding WGR domain protein
MTRKLIYQDEKSSKFWSIETKGNSFTVTFGKTGTNGQSQTKKFENKEKCLKEAEKLVNEKLKKGYAELKNDSSKSITQSAEEDATVSKYLKSKSELEFTFADYDHEYERMVDVCINLPELKIDIDYTLEINKDYLGMDGEKEKSAKDGVFDSRQINKTIFYASDISMQKFIHMLIDELCSNCFEIYYKYKKTSETIEQDFSLKLINLFFGKAGIDKSKKSGTKILSEAQFKNSIKEIEKWFTVEENFFVNSLVSVSPEKQIEKTVENARKYSLEGDYQKAIEIFNKAQKLLFIPKTVSQKYALKKFYLQRGLCYKKIKDLENAILDFTHAFNCGDRWAGELLISLYIKETPDYNKALEIANELGTFNDYNYGKCSDVNYKLINYKGLIRVLRGDKKEAEEIYHVILDDFGIQYPEKINASIKDLEEIISNNKPNAANAKEILSWFKVSN